MTQTSVQHERTPATVARDRRNLRLYPLLIAAGIGTAMLTTRLWGITHSLWWDEAYTAWAYITRPGAIRDPDRYLGNNHVLFSWLSHHTTELAGSTWEPIIRFWSVFPGLIATAVLTVWLWRRVSPALALTTLGVLYVSVAHARHIPEARGYGLVLLGSVVLIAAGSAASEDRPSWLADASFAIGGAVGIAAIPTLAFAAIPQGGAALVCRQHHRVRLLTGGAMAAGLLAVWYWPLRAPMLHYRTSVGSRSGDPVTPTNFLTLPVDHLVAGPLATMLPGLPAGAVLMVAFGLTAAGIVQLLRTQRAVGVQVLVGLVGSMIVIGLVGVHAQPRYLFFLLPHAAIALSSGLVWAATALADHLPPRAARSVVMLLVALALLRGTAEVMEVRQTPRQAFADSVEAILESDVETLYTDRLHIGYRWYLGPRADEVITIDRTELAEVVCGADGSAAYLPYPRSDTYPDALVCFGDPEWTIVDPASTHPTPVWIRRASEGQG